MASFYRVVGRTAVLEQFQYRAANYAYMIGMVAEPVIYLVVWSTVARGSGGEVRGFSPGDFAAYYIVWTLVRNMNIVLTPFAWEERIRTGELSGMLLRPVHPLHYDIAYFGGWKVVVIVMWIPIAIVLSLLFRPTFDITVLEALVFLVAIWGAYLIRTLFLWLLGMVTFWTTRVSALYETFFTAELLLSGRLVPMELMPAWVVRIANFLPFRSTFGFPIEVLAADPTPAQLGRGLLTQALWIFVGAGLVMGIWRSAVKRYSAVGN
jgi:ABC-2 type transport system permease protein